MRKKRKKERKNKQKNRRKRKKKDEYDSDDVTRATNPPPLLPCSNQDTPQAGNIKELQQGIPRPYQRGKSGTACTVLEQPQLDSRKPVTGNSKDRHRKENKWKQRIKQVAQGVMAATAAHGVSYWDHHQGLFDIPTPKQPSIDCQGSMCLSGLALDHPAADVLLEYAHKGCPVNTGKPWLFKMMEAAVARGPNVSAVDEEAMAILQEEVEAKAVCGQCKIVTWEELKNHSEGVPKHLKVSPVAMIPHKSRKYRAILDLSFGIRLLCWEQVPAVNESSIKTAPKGAIDQLGQSLNRIIHAMAQADDDAKVFMAKWDIKHGFWRLDCQQDEEWNFRMSCHRKRAHQSSTWYQLHSKWVGSNHISISVQHRRLVVMWPNNMPKHH